MNIDDGTVETSVAKQKDHMRTTMQSNKRKKSLAATVRPNPPAQSAQMFVLVSTDGLFPPFFLYFHSLFILSTRLGRSSSQRTSGPLSLSIKLIYHPFF